MNDERHVPRLTRDDSNRDNQLPKRPKAWVLLAFLGLFLLLKHFVH